MAEKEQMITVEIEADDAKTIVIEISALELAANNDRCLGHLVRHRIREKLDG